MRASARPRSRPAAPPRRRWERSASISSTSTKRVSTSSRAGRCARDSASISRTSTASASTPRRCISAGSSDTSSAASEESNWKKPPSRRTSAGPSCSPWRTSSIGGGAARGSISSGATASKPDSVKPGVSGSSTKSPASSVAGACPVDGQQAASLQHHAEARLPEAGIAHRPAAGAADAFRMHRAGLQQRDDVFERDRSWQDSHK